MKSKLHTEWMDVYDCWGVVMANGHLLTLAAQKGRQSRTFENLVMLCKAWNDALATDKDGER